MSEYILLSEQASGDLLLATDGYHPLLGERILAPGCGSRVVTAEGQRAGSRGVFQLD